MSTLKTLSTFYYGFLISKNNQNIDFSEGGPEITATIDVADYSLTEILIEIQNALNLVGANEYVVTCNRATRVITIAANGPFSLLVATGSHFGTSIFGLLGFTGADNTGFSTYAGLGPAGFQYRPQTLLKDYISPIDWELKESAVVSVSAAGQVQTVAFGDGQRMQCNIIAVTDLINLDNRDFFENATGVNDLRTFLRYLITKSKIEFIPDIADPDTYYKLLLESSEADKSGVAFKIKNMQGSHNYYQSGNLLFRKVID